MTWQLLLYALVLGFISVLLVPLTSLWWIVLLLGVVLPAAVAISGARCNPRRQDDPGVKARELLATLANRGELTVAEAAMTTSCTAAEASLLLEGMASQGRLVRQSRGRIATYALLGERFAPALPSPATDETRGGDASRDQIAEPLTEREREVLALLASGRTNAEAARDLFVSVGTIKSHTGNIYRKLGAKNRAQAISRARDLGLLP
jgi:ATP/maltotriose-dependent transcriptional regulator MalT